MDEIQQRLSETSQATIEAYVKWHEARNNSEAREVLADAVHELRKVASRLEIEMAVSERDEQSKRRIPIPHHRSKKNADNNKDNAEQEKTTKASAEEGSSVETVQLPKRRRSPSATGGARPRRSSSSNNNTGAAAAASSESAE